MPKQLSFVRPFRVRSGAIGDQLWEILYELGVQDGDATFTDPEVEFVSNLHANTAPGAEIVLITVAELWEEAYLFRRKVDYLYRVDVEGRKLALLKRQLLRILTQRD
ncbi:hypothetical protein GF360_02485 [candidate division WWE3 bacterium]|nr:hypothetical protein [candidate division WWE3 bacterium]